MTYKRKPDPQVVALRQRLKELAATRIRYGYRRLTVCCAEAAGRSITSGFTGLYKQEGLELRYKRHKKRAAQIRVPLPGAARPNERWSMDFVTDRLEDGRLFRILTVVDQYDTSRKGNLRTLVYSTRRGRSKCTQVVDTDLSTGSPRSQR
jgi:putative transposase